MPTFRPRNETVTAYQYTGTSMDGQVATLLGAANCVAASGTRPALVYLAMFQAWYPLKPGMWAIIRTDGMVELVGNQRMVMGYRNVTGEPVVTPPVDPGPDA